MREFLDAILEFIEAESLTDEEYASTQPLADEEYTLEVYEALHDVLSERESISDTLDRLKAYFQAKGVTISSEAHPAVSNILIGAVLD